MERIPIAIRLKEAMELKGFRQVDLVSKTQINKALISRYLSNQVEPQTDNIYLMAKALNVNPAWLMGLNVPMARPDNDTSNLKSANTQVLANIATNPRVMAYVEKLMELPDLDKKLVFGNIDMLYNRIKKDGE